VKGITPRKGHELEVHNNGDKKYFISLGWGRLEMDIDDVSILWTAVWSTNTTKRSQNSEAQEVSLGRTWTCTVCKLWREMCLKREKDVGGSIKMNISRMNYIKIKKNLGGADCLARGGWIWVWNNINRIHPILWIHNVWTKNII